MATINFFVSAKKMNPAPIYLRFVAGKGKDFITKSGFVIDPQNWNNEGQNVEVVDPKGKKVVLGKTSLELKIREEYAILCELKEDPSLDWLTGVINQYHNPTSDKSKDLNEFIEAFISEAEAGTLKNKGAMNYSTGTLRSYRGFQRIFNEYQGVYTEKRLKQIEEENEKRVKEHLQPKELRPKKLLNFHNIDLAFYEKFRTFLSDQGYKLNMIGRVIKQLKYFMQKALDQGLHDNRHFQNKSVFRGVTEESFSIALSLEEIDKIYNLDLSDPKDKKLKIARDSWICMADTALRVSDYPKIGQNVKTVGRRKYITIKQSKTGGDVVIPLTARLEAILKEYDNKPPQMLDVLINLYIKSVAFRAGLTDVITWEANKLGKKYEKSAPKWKLVTCHTARRSAATNMYLNGINSLSIMQITGHATESSFMRYIKIDKEENAIRMAENPFFTTKLKVV